METRHYWEENGVAVKYDNFNASDGFGRVAEQLNFAAPSEDEGEYPPAAYLKKGKVSRQDPMSHRIIEKRRRDRMNNCLADLSRLIPPEYLKKGRGRVEKTEIIEMAIRHLKFLQERANGVYHGIDTRNAAERQEELFRAGYQEAAAEAVRYLVEAQGYGPADGLGAHLATHLQRHCDIISKGEGLPLPREKLRTHPGSSSETASSSSSSHGFVVKPAGVITAAPPPAPPPYAEPFEPDHAYPMDCDRGTPSLSGTGTGPCAGPEMDGDDEPLDARRRDPRDDYLHSYKFKNSIERRFSRSQDCEAAEVAARAANGIVNGKTYGHKRRRAVKPAHSTSTSTEDARDTSPQDTSSESPHHHHPYEKPPPPPAQFVPVFALNALGKYYVPLSVEYSCLARHGGGAALGGGGGGNGGGPLHPVTIHVNFQPCLPLCRLKSEPPA